MNDKKPVVSMSRLGKSGRFGNQIFQYAFLKIYAEKNNLRVECPSWVGQEIFGYKDHPISKLLEPAIEINEHQELLFDRFPYLILDLEKRAGCKSIRIDQAILDSDICNIDLFGSFQFHTRVFEPYRDFFCSIFQPVDELQQSLETGLQHIYSKGKTIVGIHIRRGDYITKPLLGCCLSFPVKWYRQQLEKIWHELEEPVLFLCSDDLDAVLPEFEKFSPITLKNLPIELPKDFEELNIDFYIDFFVLSKCDIAIISNSTFSFAACMLNERGNKFFRPHWDFVTKFVEFTPWNSKPLLWIGNDKPKFSKSILDVFVVAFMTQGVFQACKTIFVYLPRNYLLWKKRDFMSKSRAGKLNRFETKFFKNKVFFSLLKRIQ